MRSAKLSRNTSETQITAELCLDGKGVSKIDTGCGFLDHMLTLFARHGRFDLSLSCKGDTYVDMHHTVEDCGIVLGTAFKQALGDLKGITRFGYFVMPMDEALILVSLDISGRAYYAAELDIPAQRIGDFDTELADEFFLAFSRSAGITLHIRQLSGKNSHHIIEAAFKGFAKVLSDAVKINKEFADEIPSTKGIL